MFYVLFAASVLIGVTFIIPYMLRNKANIINQSKFSLHLSIVFVYSCFRHSPFIIISRTNMSDGSLLNEYYRERTE
jgi:hypothetical protein